MSVSAPAPGAPRWRSRRRAPGNDVLWARNRAERIGSRQSLDCRAPPAGQVRVAGDSRSPAPLSLAVPDPALRAVLRAGDVPGCWSAAKGSRLARPLPLEVAAEVPPQVAGRGADRARTSRTKSPPACPPRRRGGARRGVARPRHAPLGPPPFRLYGNDDAIGAQLGGAAKNVVAIAAGAVTGAGLGENARAALITRGLAELARLAAALGGRPETVWASPASAT